MNVMFVTRDFPQQVIYQNTKGLTQETNLMNVLFVTRDFPQQVIYQNTKGLTQERDLMHVMFVTRGFPHQTIDRDTKACTQASKCDVCNKKLRHKRTYTGNKPYEVMCCVKRFHIIFVLIN